MRVLIENLRAYRKTCVLIEFACSNSDRLKIPTVPEASHQSLVFDGHDYVQYACEHAEMIAKSVL